MGGEAGSKRKLHVEQNIEAPATQLGAQIAASPPSGPLVDGDKLDAVEESHESRFGLADDPGELGLGPDML